MTTYQTKAPFAECWRCPLALRPMCRTHIPEGDIGVFVIGEAPGIQEIIEGVPFIGETGKILDHMLAHIEIDPASVARSNAVLCRPIGNDDPPDEAVSACARRLQAEIHASGATNVIALGAVAARALDTLAGRAVDGGIMARAGRSYEADGYRYTTTVNPAFLLRADSYAPNFVRHLRRGVSPRNANFDAERVAYVVMTPANADRVLDYLYSFPVGAPMAYDVETDHLQWFDTFAVDAAPLLCVVLTLEDWRSVIIPADMLIDIVDNDAERSATYTDVCDDLRTLFNRYNVIGHNVKFDQNVTAMRLAIEFDATDDTMLMHHTLQELGAHGLKELGAEYLGAPDYEGALVDDWFKANGISKDKRRYGLLPKANLYKYAAIDGALTLQLWRIFEREMRETGVYDRPYRATVMPISNALQYVERTGIKIDRAQLMSARIEFGTELAAIEDEMNGIVMPLLESASGTPADELRRLMRTREAYAPDQPLLTKTGKPKARQTLYREVFKYNPSSPPQTSHILYGLLGFERPKLVKETATATGKEALELLPDHAFIRALRRHRRISKMLDTYIEGIDRRADVNDTLHVDFRITGTEIGRLSASNGDHGIPRPDDYYGAMIRSAFIADTDNDEVLVLGDYSQAELRAFAWLANVKFLLTKYRNGEDVHTETALMLERMGAPAFRHFAEYYARGKAGDVLAGNTAKKQRTLAKNINFGGLVYQGGPNGIAGMMGGNVSVKAIADALAFYKPLMPEADVFAAKQFEQLRTRGYVETVFGRRRRFYVISDFNEDDARKAAVHMVVAGSAADLTNTSAVRLVRDGIRVCHSVHDSLIARAKRNEAAEVAAHMREVMQSTGAEFMPGIPWVADIDIADRWCDVPTRAALETADA